ncbi:hypothetical protein BT69DRAFT_1335019 [Atractiella rhizophila]|nr:hypothetical protein BT69DRAFT_1335019 [Atractiella rhizophila]
MKKIFDKPPTSQHREEALSALGQTEDSESLEKFFDMISDPASVSDNELQIGTGPTVLNITARRPMWKWMKDNYDSINKRLGATWSIGFIIRDCVRGCVNLFVFYGLPTKSVRFTAESDAQEVEAFFEDKDTSMYKKSLDQALDTIRARTAWLKRDAGDVEEWLKHHGFLDAKIGDKDLHLE